MRRFLSASIVLLALTVVGACSNNPSAPSGSSGVTINGSIISPGGSASALSNGPSAGITVVPPGLTVTANSNGASAIVDAAGRFALLNVPPGNVELRFNAPGVLATVTLTGVESGQTVDITVALTTTTAEVESDRRALGREIQLEGRIESLPPTTAAGSLLVSGRLVKTDATTTFFLNGQTASFAALAVGQRVHVKGQMDTASTALVARTIQIQNGNVDLPVNINGFVSQLVKTLPTFEFEVDGRLIKGDALTEFFGNSQLSDLVNGARVDVKGAQRDGFVYASRIHVHQN
ncbi:MAG TPA: DUF5666 domain-containing protein [Vicinamibacterales bacterium]|nr:DUF5666 domain-containing protein [Vicinamibacterales bacterium]